MTLPDLATFDLWDLIALPRPDDPPAQRSGASPTADDSVRLALVAAYADLVTRPSDRQPALLVAWLRDASNRVRFVCGADPVFSQARPACDGDDAAVLFPLGARGVRADPDETSRWLRALRAWVGVEGQFAPRAAETDDDHPVDSRLDDCIAHMTGTRCAVVLVAHPLSHADIDRQLNALERDLPALRAQSSVEGDRLRTRRHERRYEELTDGHATGVWAVQVLAGADDEAAATGLAAMVCNTGAVATSPYSLRPKTAASGAPQPTPFGAAEWMSPVIGGVDLLAAVARPPQRELPGIRLQSPSTFDVTPEPRPAGGTRDDTGPGVLLGSIIDHARAVAGDLSVSFDTLNRHTFVCGATGSGKSQTVRALLERATAEGLRWLVIEPAKAEYARMAGRLGRDDVTVIRPGDPSLVPASLNPLEPEPGFPLQSHIDLVRALFMAAFDADEPFPQVLAHALIAAYDYAGWDLSTGEPKAASGRRAADRQAAHPAYPTLRHVQQAALRVIDDIGYGREVTDNIRGFVDVRLSSLRLGASGRFFEGGHPIDIAELMRRNVVLEIENITNDQDKAFLIGAVLIRVVEHLRVRAASAPEGVDLHHLTVIEEAHRLLRNSQEGPRAQAVEIFASLLAEIRAYGEGIIVAEQIPSKILPDVVKNSALKVMHRLPAKDDRDVVGATMNLQPEQSEFVVGMPPGVAAVSTDGMDRPILVRMPGDPDGRESADRVRRDPPLLGRRSPLCGSECKRQPCTARQVREGELGSEDPVLTLWIDATVAAHVMGSRAPTPTASYTEELRGTDPRRFQCALAFAAERSVMARHEALTPDGDATAFADHIIKFAVHHVFDEPDPCGADDHRWGPARRRNDANALVGDPGRSGVRDALRQLNAKSAGAAARTLSRCLEGHDAAHLFATLNQFATAAPMDTTGTGAR